ncbi:unnamed protein product [Camellia sinensis]
MVQKMSKYKFGKKQGANIKLQHYIYTIYNTPISNHSSQTIQPTTLIIRKPNFFPSFINSYRDGRCKERDDDQRSEFLREVYF